ncbi:hypothetical protein [Pontibacter sp. HSC-14F20]|uniref:hypothetical protein n=1 Tax=Pontibacter sp. HSC-14F20 TaxID=2864136 RepID=UPI0021029B58|nr:hypothetical protein [Pontibacter sp. HSC-14F20]
MRNTILTLLTCLTLFSGITSCGAGDPEQSMAAQQADEHQRLEEVQEEHIRRGSASNQDTIPFGQAFARFMAALQASDTPHSTSSFIRTTDFGL